MDFLDNIDGSNVNLTPKGIILGNVQFESYLPVPNCMLIFKYSLYICICICMHAYVCVYMHRCMCVDIILFESILII